MKYDVGIVGAGLAGLSTALSVCHDQDVTLILIERRKIGDPKKTSPFTFPDVMEKHKLTDAVIQSYRRFTYRSPCGNSATFEFPEPAFVTLDYEQACKNLLQRIEKHGNAEILENTEVTRFEVTNNSSSIRLSLDDREVKVNVLVDASGKEFLAAKALHLALPSYYSHAYGQVLQKCEIEDPNEMHILAGKRYGNGGGWFYPVDTTTARFGVATVTRSKKYPSAVVRSNFLRACKNFHPYSDFVKNAKRVRPEFGTIPIGPLKRFVHDKILLVGDSAGQATPWYCEGIRPALESGTMCGKAISKACRESNHLRKRLKEYETEWTAKYGYSYRMAMRRSFYQWFRSQEEWNEGVERNRLLSPMEMVAKVRHGWQGQIGGYLNHIKLFAENTYLRVKYSLRHEHNETG